MKVRKDTQWDNLHKNYYSKQDWINKPNIFAEEVLEYFPEKGYILCLGDGQGQDARFFATKGYKVLTTDKSTEALKVSSQKILEQNLKNITAEKLDLTLDLPFDKGVFDVVYAHLSLHYFSEEKTKQIFKEIQRVLIPGGILAVFVNSVNDPEFNSGKRIEQEYFEIEGMKKRFFSKYSMDYFTKDFQVILLDDKGRTYKDDAKGIHNLVRFVGRNHPRSADDSTI